MWVITNLLYIFLGIYALWVIWIEHKKRKEQEKRIDKILDNLLADVKGVQ